MSETNKVSKEQLRDLVGRPLVPFFSSASEDADRGDWHVNDTGEKIFVREWCNDGYFHHPEAIATVNSKASAKSSSPSRGSASNQKAASLKKKKSDESSSAKSVKATKSSSSSSNNKENTSFSPFSNSNTSHSDFSSLNYSHSIAPAFSLDTLLQMMNFEKADTSTASKKSASSSKPIKKSAKVSSVSSKDHYAMPEFLTSAPDPSALPLPSFQSPSFASPQFASPLSPSKHKLSSSAVGGVASPTSVLKSMLQLPKVESTILSTPSASPTSSSSALLTSFLSTLPIRSAPSTVQPASTLPAPVQPATAPILKLSPPSVSSSTTTSSINSPSRTASSAFIPVPSFSVPTLILRQNGKTQFIPVAVS